MLFSLVLQKVQLEVPAIDYYSSRERIQSCVGCSKGGISIQQCHYLSRWGRTVNQIFAMSYFISMVAK